MKICKIKEQKDGSAVMTYQLNDQEIACFKTAAKIKKRRFSKKFINECMLEAITQRLAEEMTNAKTRPTR